MKKISLSIAMICLSAMLFAQKISEKELPAAVKTAFQKSYPSVSKAKWTKEESDFEASFDLKGRDVSATWNAAGKLLETETEIELNELPKGVLDYAKNKYAGKSVKEAAKITDAKGAVTFEVEINGMDLLFDEQGSFIKAVKA